MPLPDILFSIVGVALCGLLLTMAASSVAERKARAAIISVILTAIVVLSWWAVLFLFRSDLIMIVTVAATGLLAALFFLPLGKLPSMSPCRPTERVDERDTVFAREEYQPGSDKYRQYYERRPELKDADDSLRRFPGLLKPGGRYYDERKARQIQAVFGQIKSMTTSVDGPVNAEQQVVDPGKMTREVKARLIGLGADDVGITELNPMYIYSHVGRGPEEYGSRITTRHKYAIVFTLEMSYPAVETAPDLPITEETALQYLRAARLSVSTAQHIRQLGFPARAHISDSNYQIMLPPVAQDAGLGELGRLGYLISPRLGARLRLGGVTTDMPLTPDRPITFGVQDFCSKCLKCAVNCPSSAIPSGGRSDVRGVDKWALDMVRCLRYWRIAGTDCGICMKVCPYSHPPTFIHNLVRAGIRRSAVARTISIWADDLFYGRKVLPPGPQ